MFDTGALLDAAKSRHSLPSDYALAKTLGVGQSLLSGYRAGRSRPDDAIARRLAELAGLDADIVVVELAAERAQTDEARALWLRVAERLKKGAGTTLAAAVFSTFFTGNPDGTALAKARAGADSADSQARASQVIHCGSSFQTSAPVSRSVRAGYFQLEGQSPLPLILLRSAPGGIFTAICVFGSRQRPRV
jgi:transcriptional regulator with XRE-family HTH domain